MMRPRGVVSKNAMGARNTALSNSACRIRDELTQAIAKPNDIPKTEIAVIRNITMLMHSHVQFMAMDTQ
jgi:hypothetical protein